MEKEATFGAGCFWGVEAAFRRIDGVTATRVAVTPCGSVAYRATSSSGGSRAARHVSLRFPEREAGVGQAVRGHSRAMTLQPPAPKPDPMPSPPAPPDPGPPAPKPDPTPLPPDPNPPQI